MKPSKEQLPKLLKLWEKTECPECKGKKTVKRSGCAYHCPTCKGTGRRYQLAVVDLKGMIDVSGSLLANHAHGKYARVIEVMEI